MKIDQYGRPKRIVFDLDDTLAVERWPELGEWIPGRGDLLQGVLDAGYQAVLHTCRLHPKGTDGKTREQADWLIELGRVRKFLTDAGFKDVPVLIDPKPHARVYVDDRAVRPGENWRKTLREVLKVAGS